MRGKGAGMAALHFGTGSLNRLQSLTISDCAAPVAESATARDANAHL
jgi:hypothetical protein